MKDCNEVHISISHLLTELLEGRCISHKLMRNVGVQGISNYLLLKKFISICQLGAEFLKNKSGGTRKFG